MGIYYETRAVRQEECGTGVEIEHYTSLEAAIVGSLELWPEDDQSDVLVFAMTDDKIDLAATIRHHHLDDPSIATVCVLTTACWPGVNINYFKCEYVEIFGRIHTNITRVEE